MDASFPQLPRVSSGARPDPAYFPDPAPRTFCSSPFVPLPMGPMGFPVFGHVFPGRPWL